LSYLYWIPDSMFMVLLAAVCSRRCSRSARSRATPKRDGGERLGSATNDHADLPVLF
jgi:hypothetical protein